MKGIQRGINTCLFAFDKLLNCSKARFLVVLELVILRVCLGSTTCLSAITVLAG